MLSVTAMFPTVPTPVILHAMKAKAEARAVAAAAHRLSMTTAKAKTDIKRPMRKIFRMGLFNLIRKVLAVPTDGLRKNYSL